MLKKLFLIFFFALNLTNAQQYVNWDTMKEKQLDWIVFTAGISAKPTSNVKMIDSLVEYKNIETLRGLIYSENVALKGLSSLVLELFEEEGIIELKEEELIQIKRLYKTEEEIYTFSGCTPEYGDILTLPIFFRDYKSYVYKRYSYFIDEFY